MVLQVLKNFAGKTSIHGLGFVVDYRLSVFTRVTWALIFTAAIIWASIQLQFSVTCKLSVKFLRKTCKKSCKSFFLLQSSVAFGFSHSWHLQVLVVLMKLIIIQIELLIFLSLVHRSYKVSHTGSIPE